ncbi:MAG: aminodeoxychorismate synthase component I [Methylotenera sp.]|nr:aminodeoxychorismate synthase component I [Methylotenera sp.]
MLKHALTYHHDSALLFERIAQQPWAMLLDSGQMLNPATGKAGSQYGHYDILVAEPFITLVTQGNVTTITQNGVVETSEEDPFLLLKNILAQYQAPKSELPFAGGTFPFTGGALGYFAYDLARRIEKLPSNALPAVEMPEMMIGIYDWALVVDHREKTTHLVSHALLENTREKLDALQALFSAAPRASSLSTPFVVTSEVTSNMDKPCYERAFNQVKKYIDAGDCYQVNLAQRFSAQVEGDSWQAYKKLREISPAPFMAYMNLPLTDNENFTENFQVLSNSPERFIQVSGDHVETRPIKGTRPRFSDPAQDLKSANELEISPKDKAENVMIVDLLRNDLGKTCAIGSVKVKQLFQLQSFANVHHLVSIIVGKLKPSATAVDVLRSCFPGGSITGAPKLRAMQIIDELEPHRRGLYCGVIGYIGFDGNMDTNIAIRTVVNCKKVLSFYAGGGIVADSEVSKEYDETLDKAASITTITKFFTRL